MNWNVQPLLLKWKSPRWESNQKPLAQETLKHLLDHHAGAAWVANSAFYLNHATWGSSIAISSDQLCVTKGKFSPAVLSPHWQNRHSLSYENDIFWGRVYFAIRNGHIAVILHLDENIILVRWCKTLNPKAKP